MKNTDYRLQTKLFTTVWRQVMKKISNIRTISLSLVFCFFSMSYGAHIYAEVPSGAVKNSSQGCGPVSGCEYADYNQSNCWNKEKVTLPSGDCKDAGNTKQSDNSYGMTIHGIDGVGNKYSYNCYDKPNGGKWYKDDVPNTYKCVITEGRPAN
jgi:hypothetical protein